MEKKLKKSQEDKVIDDELKINAVLINQKDMLLKKIEAKREKL